jgi:monoamine oxidase
MNSWVITILLLTGVSAHAETAWQVLSRDLPANVQKLAQKSMKAKEVEKLLGKPKRKVKDGAVEQWHYNLTGLDYDLSLRLDHGKTSFFKFAPVSKYLRQYNFSVLLKSLNAKEQRTAQSEFDLAPGATAEVKVESIHTTFEFSKIAPYSFRSLTKKVSP